VVGEVVRKVRVISSTTSTPSTSIWGRSGKMIIGWVGSSKKFFKREKMFNFSVYHILDQQGCVTTIKWFTDTSGGDSDPKEFSPLPRSITTIKLA